MNYSSTHNKNQLVSYSLLNRFENLLAFTTTRNTFSSFNLRFTGDFDEIIKSNRIELAKILKLKPGQFVFPRQEHTRNIVSVLQIPETEITQTDALITNQRGICLCIQTADCVPLLLFDPVKKVTAAVHTGWRGTVQKISEAVIHEMTSKYKSRPENILAVIGPSISPEVYEVGEEVVAAVRSTIPDAAKTHHINSSGNTNFNLWEANRQLLLKSGVLSENIEVLGECSFLLKDKYFSARREGLKSGRMVSGILLI